MNDELFLLHRSSFLLHRLARASYLDAAVDGFENEPAVAARADGAGQPAPAERARDGHREVGRDLAVERLGLDPRAQARGQGQVDAAVDGLEFEPPRPVAATHDGRDGAVDGLRAGEARGRDVDAAVDGLRVHVRAEALGRDVAVDGAALEVEAR